MGVALLAMTGMVALVVGAATLNRGGFGVALFGLLALFVAVLLTP